MQNKEISQKVLNPNAVAWITKLQSTLMLRGYGKGSIRNYVNEMILLFKYFNLKQVEQITQHDIDITLCPSCKVGRMETMAAYRNGILCKGYEPKVKYTPDGIIRKKALP